MSSVYVRTEIQNFLDLNTSEDYIDLSGQFSEIQDLVSESGLLPNDPWVGIEFVGNDEVPVTVGSHNSQGMYREIGAIYFHVVAPAGLGVQGAMLTRTEAIRDLLRGMRINNILIESVTPPTFDSGLRFEGGYLSCSFFVSYEYEFNL
jgi:hypothetical protein